MFVYSLVAVQSSLIPEYFHTPREITYPSAFLSDSHQSLPTILSLPTTNLLVNSVDLSILIFLYKQNHSICDLIVTGFLDLAQYRWTLGVFAYLECDE